MAKESSRMTNKIPINKVMSVTPVRPGGGSGSGKPSVKYSMSHMLQYIDQLERENHRHSKTVEQSFQVLRRQLTARYLMANGTNGPQDMRANAVAQHWRSVFTQMEQDLTLNQLSADGIARNLSLLRTQFDISTSSPQVSKQRSISSVTYTEAMSMQYQSPLTNPKSLTHSHSLASEVEVVRSKSRHSPVSLTEGVFKVPQAICSSRTRSTRNETNAAKTITGRKRKLDESDDFKSIMEATKFWHIELDHRSQSYQRFVNIIYGLPKCDPLETMTAQQYRQYIHQAVGWIEQCH